MVKNNFRRMTLSDFNMMIAPLARFPRTVALAAGALALSLSMTACKPDYPKCDKDEHCNESEKGKNEGKLYCVNGMCQQCRQDADCGDPTMTCAAGVCEQTQGYCTTTADCGQGEKCEANRCQPECSSDAECGVGGKCVSSRCVSSTQCSVDGDCGSGQICDAGTCVAASDGPTDCSLITVYFAFDDSTLSADSKASLDRVAQCIKEKQFGTIEIAGHTDEVGSEEYNIALGERRATSVREYLTRLGVKQGALKTISYGEEVPQQNCGEGAPDTCRRTNRRVEFAPN